MSYNRSTSVAVSVFFAVAAMASSAAFALDVNLAKAGISVSDPGNANQVYAARELEKHLNLISGCKDRKRTGGANAVFVIGSPAPGMRKAVDFEALAAVKDGKVYFWGDDGRSAYKGEVPCGGSMLTVTGQVRSHNLRTETGRKLMIFVFAATVIA